MAKNWVAFNAQNRVVGRFEHDYEAAAKWPEAVRAGTIVIQYQPRKAKAKNVFPYNNSTGRL